MLRDLLLTPLRPVMRGVLEPSGTRTLAQQIAAMSPSLWLEPSVTKGYQDSAGTTALTQPGGGSADPPVGLAMDLSGNGRNASQATSTARPKLSARANLLTYTEDFSNAVWQKANASVTPGQADPLGGTSAATVTATGADARCSRFDAAATVTSGVTYTLSVYLRRKTGSGDIKLGCDAAPGYFSPALAVTSEWQRFSFTFTATATLADVRVPHVFVSGDEVDVWGAQLELGSTASRYQRVTDANTYDSAGFPLYWKFDKVDDRLLVTVPPGGWTGTMIHSTIAGTISYAATLPAGSFAIGTNGVDNYYTPDNRLVGQIFVNSALSDSDAGKVKDYFVGRGGGPKDAGAYAGVTDFSGAWAYCSSMTGPFPLIDTSNGTNFSGAWGSCSSMTGPFPLIDTSSGTDFSVAWYGCGSMTGPFPLIDTSSGTDFTFAWAGCSSMTGPFPLIDTSSGTNFFAAWYGCSSLTSFPAGMFDTCPATNFTDAFVDCALNQTSIDNILVSIAAAGTSGGMLNMTGGTNATPSATGLAAKATLVGRGWTVTHN